MKKDADYEDFCCSHVMRNDLIVMHLSHLSYNVCTCLINQQNQQTFQLTPKFNVTRLKCLGAVLPLPTLIPRLIIDQLHIYQLSQIYIENDKMASSTSAPPTSSNEAQPRVESSTTGPSNVAVTGSRPPMEIHPTAHLDPQAYVQGTFTITLGPNVVIHPRARLVSAHGPVMIRAGTVISERCVIGGPAPDSKAPPSAPPEVPVMTEMRQDVMLHASVEIQAGAYLDEACLIEPRAVVQKDVKIGKHCKVCAGCVVDRSVRDWTVVWGDGQRRRLRTGAIDPENGRLKALEIEREATAGLLKAAAAKATLGKRRG
jgi:carbonic anhydrase/acetyltransferase-like protein (isoleucine patch superfamily)